MLRCLVVVLIVLVPFTGYGKEPCEVKYLLIGQGSSVLAVDVDDWSVRKFPSVAFSRGDAILKVKYYRDIEKIVVCVDTNEPNSRLGVIDLKRRGVYYKSASDIDERLHYTSIWGIDKRNPYLFYVFGATSYDVAVSHDKGQRLPPSACRWFTYDVKEDRWEKRKNEPEKKERVCFLDVRYGRRGGIYDLYKRAYKLLVEKGILEGGSKAPEDVVYGMERGYAVCRKGRSLLVVKIEEDGKQVRVVRESPGDLAGIFAYIWKPDSMDMVFREEAGILEGCRIGAGVRLEKKGRFRISVDSGWAELWRGAEGGGVYAEEGCDVVTDIGHRNLFWLRKGRLKVLSDVVSDDDVKIFCNGYVIETREAGKPMKDREKADFWVEKEEGKVKVYVIEGIVYIGYRDKGGSSECGWEVAIDGGDYLIGRFMCEMGREGKMHIRRLTVEEEKVFKDMKGEWGLNRARQKGVLPVLIIPFSSP